MSGNSNGKIDFEYWMALASSDPRKFEQLRQDKISAAIEKATSKRQQRLRGLQWRIDRIRDRHKNSASAACLEISELMWETFEHLAEILQFQTENGLPAPGTAMQTNVIPFPNKVKDQI